MSPIRRLGADASGTEPATAEYAWTAIASTIGTSGLLHGLSAYQHVELESPKSSSYYQAIQRNLLRGHSHHHFL